MEMTALFYIPALILAVSFLSTGRMNLLQAATALMLIEATLMSPGSAASYIWAFVLLGLTVGSEKKSLV